MKVVSLADSGDRGICHNPELALVNTLAPANWSNSSDARMCSHTKATAHAADSK